MRLGALFLTIAVVNALVAALLFRFIALAAHVLVWPPEACSGGPECAPVDSWATAVSQMLGEPFSARSWGRACGVAYVGLAAVQVGLLWPIATPVRTSERAWSLVASATVAGGLGAALATGLFASVVELSIAPDAGPWLERSLVPRSPFLTRSVLAATWIVTGALWAYLLWRVGRAREPRGAELVVRAALTATALEVALAVPLHALVARRHGCTCHLHSTFTVALGVTSLVLLCGPWAVFLFLRRRPGAWRRRPPKDGVRVDAPTTAP